MELVAGPSESFFLMPISKHVYNHFFIKLLSGLVLPILEEIILRVYYVTSCTTINSYIIKSKEMCEVTIEVNLIIQS